MITQTIVKNQTVYVLSKQLVVWLLRLNAITYMKYLLGEENDKRV